MPDPLRYTAPGWGLPGEAVPAQQDAPARDRPSRARLPWILAVSASVLLIAAVAVLVWVAWPQSFPPLPVPSPVQSR